MVEPLHTSDSQNATQSPGSRVSVKDGGDASQTYDEQLINDFTPQTG